MTPIARPFAASLILALSLSGCANCSLDGLRSAVAPVKRSYAPTRKRAKVKQAALPKPAAELRKSHVETASKTDEGRQWCRQRFIDHQAGRRPGEARSVEQKKSDDEFCAVLTQD
jgi:hypothetical protein